MTAATPAPAVPPRPGSVGMARLRRLLPPLIVTPAELEEATERLHRACLELEKAAPAGALA